MGYKQLDDFPQPPELALRFSSFVEEQARSGDYPKLRKGAFVSSIKTLANTSVPEVVYPGVRLVTGARYVAQLGLSELHLRAWHCEELIFHYVRYVYSERLGGLLVAHETDPWFISQGHELSEATQTLATILEQEPFERGLVDYNGRAKLYGLVGPEEFAALGNFLIGHEIE